MVKSREVIIFTGDVAFSREAISTATHSGEGLQAWCAAQESRNPDTHSRTGSAGKRCVLHEQSFQLH